MEKASVLQKDPRWKSITASAVVDASKASMETCGEKGRMKQESVAEVAASPCRYASNEAAFIWKREMKCNSTARVLVPRRRSLPWR